MGGLTRAVVALRVVVIEPAVRWVERSRASVVARGALASGERQASTEDVVSHRGAWRARSVAAPDGTLGRRARPSAGHDGATDAAGRRAVRAAFHLGARAQARLRQRARYAAAPAKGTDARVARRERPRHAAGAGRLDLVQPNILSDGPAHRLRRRRHPAPVLLLHPSQQREHVLVLVVARETEGRVVTAAIGRVGASLKQ